MRVLFTTILILLMLQVTAQVKAGEYLDMAVKYTENGQYEQAVKICDKLLVIDSNNAGIYYLRGVNRYLLKDYENAIADFDRAIEINPDYTDAYLKRARAKKETKNYIGALRDYNHAKNENFSQTLTSLAGDVIRSVFSGD